MSFGCHSEMLLVQLLVHFIGEHLKPSHLSVSGDEGQVLLLAPKRVVSHSLVLMIMFINESFNMDKTSMMVLEV